MLESEGVGFKSKSHLPQDFWLFNQNKTKQKNPYKMMQEETEKIL